MAAAAYCAQCKIGTLDAQGLCVLCGAPAEALRGWRLAAASVVEAASAALHPAVLAGAFLIGVLAVCAALLRGGASAASLPQSRGVRALLMADPTATLGAITTDPSGTLLHLLIPAVIQAVLFGLLLMILVLLLRRLRPARPRQA